MDRLTSGTVELDGVDIEQIGLTKYRRNKSSVVFQDYKLIDYQTAASSSDIILADEPTGNLDSETEGEIIKLLQVLVKEYNKCVVVVTHSDQVAKSSDVTIKLSDGIITV